MIGEIRRLASSQPFVPFTICMGDGSAVRVPTHNHIFILPKGSRVIVSYDNDEWDILSPLLMSGVTVDSGADAAGNGASSEAEK